MNKTMNHNAKQKLTYASAHYHFKLIQSPNIEFSIIQFTGHNCTINSDYHFEINVSCNKKLNPKQTLQSIATLTFQQNSKTTYFHGYISTIIYYQYIDNLYFYKLTLHSPLFPLTQQQTSRVFVKKHCRDIIKFIFAEYSQLNLHLRLNINRKLPKLIFKTQFQETDLAFLQRLLNEHQLYLFIQQSKHSYQIIIQDQANIIKSHTASNLDLDKPNTRKSLFNNAFSYVTIHSDVPLLPGYCFHDQPQQVIMQTKHTMSLRNDYYCQATLIPQSSLFNILHITKSKRFGLYLATVYSQDERGRYYVRIDFDCIPNNICGPINVLQHHGLQLPLLPNSRVCLQFIDGDTDQPIIIGAMPNTEHPSPVTCHNKTQNIIRTHYGHGFIMDDQKDHLAIYLYTQKHSQQITLDAQKTSPNISIINTIGAIKFYSQQNMNIACKHNCKSKAANSNILVGDNYKLHTQQGSIYYRSDQNMIFTSNRDHIIKANAIVINSYKKQYYKARYDLDITNNKACYVFTQRGNVNIKATQNINITPTCQGSLLLGQANACIRSKHAKLEFHADSIILHAEKLNFVGSIQNIN